MILLIKRFHFNIIRIDHATFFPYYLEIHFVGFLLTGRDAKLRVHATGASVIGGGNRGSYGWRQVRMCQWPTACRRRGSRCGTGI